MNDVEGERYHIVTGSCFRKVHKRSTGRNTVSLFQSSAYGGGRIHLVCMPAPSL